MKCQILFSGENKKTLTSLLSAELAKRVEMVKMKVYTSKGEHTKLKVLSSLFKERQLQQENLFYQYMNPFPKMGYSYRKRGYSHRGSASVAQLDAPSDWRPGGRGFNPRRGRQHSFVEIDHEIFSTVILSLPLIQEGQLSVSGERMCTILVNRLED